MNSIKFTSKLADGSFNSKNVVSHKPPVVMYGSVIFDVVCKRSSGYRRVVIANGNFFVDDCDDGTAQSLSFSIS